MKKSIIIWNDFHFPEGEILDIIDSYLKDGCNTKELPTEADPYDDYHYIEALYGNGFGITNESKFRNGCSYSTIVLDDSGYIDHRYVGVRVEYECSDDDFVMRTLEYGENFFFKP